MHRSPGKRAPVVLPGRIGWSQPHPFLLIGLLALAAILASGMTWPAAGLAQTSSPASRSVRSGSVPLNDAARRLPAVPRGRGDGRALACDPSRALLAHSNPPLAFTAAFTDYLPIVYKPVTDLKSAVSQLSISLPQPLAATSGNWCTWGGCTLSPRLYHEPLTDGRTLVGWTDTSGNGHVSVIGSGGNVERTVNFAAQPVRGLAAHADGRFAVLLWNPASKTMWLSKREANGNETWKTNITGSLTVFDPGVGDSRLTYGNGLYAAYFTVYGVSGWVQGHNGDQLTYVDDNGTIQPGGWEWGCSHSMAELVSYHPGLSQFMPVCSSDCYASKGILIRDNEVVYACDGNCGGLVSAQLGQVALSDNSWKLVFNALNRPGYPAKGIGLASIDGSFQSSYVWLTNTTGENERDPVMARLGSSLGSDRYLVGWKTVNTGGYWLGVINGSGAFLKGPEEVSSAGIAWGNRDDSFRTRADGNVSWVQGDPGSRTLRLFRFNAAGYIP